MKREEVWVRVRWAGVTPEFGEALEINVSSDSRFRCGGIEDGLEARVVGSSRPSYHKAGFVVDRDDLYALCRRLVPSLVRDCNKESLKK